MSRKREIGSTLQPNTKGVCIILLDNIKDPEPHSPWDWPKSRIFISWATKVQWRSDHNRKGSSLELQKGNKKIEWETIYENSNIPNLHCSPKLQKTLVSTRVERERDRQRKSRHENPTRTKKRIDIVSKQQKGFRTTAQSARVKIKNFHQLSKQSEEENVPIKNYKTSRIWACSVLHSWKTATR